jgi:hypothetical protein
LSQPITITPQITSKIPGPPKVRKYRSKGAKEVKVQREFKKVRQLDDEAIQYLDRARANLIDSVAKTTRIQQAFVRELQNQSRYSDRVKYILNAAELVKLHCEFQQKLLGHDITKILDSKEKKRQEELKQEKEEARKRRRASCYTCLFLDSDSE